MALPASGPLSLSDIQTEFGGTNPISLNEYYAGGAFVPAGTSGTYGAVPTSGAISIQNFYGTADAILGGTYTYRTAVTGEAFNTVNDVESIAYNGTTFCAVGMGGNVATSTNGTTWTYQIGLRSLSTWAANDVNSIAWNGTVFCAVGTNGCVATSPDGATWTFRSGLQSTTCGSVRTVAQIIWTGTQFVVIGSAAATSPDGITWTYRSVTATSATVTRIAFNGTTYVITGRTGGVRTSTDLITWTSRDIGSLDGASYFIDWSGTAFLMASSGGTLFVYSSTDGTTWTQRTGAYTALSGEPNDIRTIYWSGTEFIIAGTGGDGVFARATADGVTYTIGVNSQVTTVNAVVKGGTRYIFGGNSGAIGTSATLTGTYTSVTQLSHNNVSLYWAEAPVNDGASNGTIFMIIGDVGVAATSADNGVTWTYRLGLRSTGWGSGSTDSNVEAVTVNGSTFLVGGERAKIATTTDGVTWTYQAGLRSTTWGTGANSDISAVLWTGTLYVAIGNARYATSPDSITWTYSATKYTFTAAPTAMILAGSVLVVGNPSSGAVYTSSNATTGTPNLAQVGTTGNGINEFAWNGTTLVAACDNGLYSSTSTFATWTLRQAGIVKSVVYNSTNSQFVAVGSSGISYYSSNGTTWTAGFLNLPPWNTIDARKVIWNGTNYAVAGDFAKIATSL